MREQSMPHCCTKASLVFAKHVGLASYGICRAGRDQSPCEPIEFLRAIFEDLLADSSDARCNYADAPQPFVLARYDDLGRARWRRSAQVSNEI